MLKVQIRNSGNVTVLGLQGRIVNGETVALREAVNSQSRASVVILDLARVSAIDASGLGLMLDLRKQAENMGIRFKLMNANRFVNRVLEITRLNSVFEITSGREFLPTISPARVMPLRACA